ncbi:armadillo-type protein [Zychaea mexicana]|uniref:armadillo-type protein n=1 Tax=Zychaea mexicana TaxID=64656 RepID=UPI0022FDB59F|nr:armadillo-type protein [Zychaea mexicana]KAI9497178.1 armadillo-type protein [Zychaea mexicana]
MKLGCVLVVNSPYDRLAAGYVANLYKTVLKRWPSGSTTIRTSILAVVSAILEKGPVEQVAPMLGSVPLVDLLLESMTTNQDAELVAMTWQTLGILAKSDLGTTRSDKWQVIQEQFEEALKNQETTIRVAALKFAESYAASMKPNEKMGQYKTWWITMLEKHIQSTCMDADAPVRSMTCDCLASMSKNVYERLPPPNQTLAITLLLPLAADQDTNVRAAACRALGVFVLFPTLHEDPLFVSDMASAVLEQMGDKALLVRARASWAQGNLCDALVMESEKPEFDIREWVSMQVWADILTTATSAALDNDKLRSNAVRSIGSLLRITPHDYFGFGRNLQLVKKAMSGVTKNIESGSLKTRWNACHAASNMLKNPEFPIGDSDRHPWTDALYHALIQSVRQCRNYKVRINACLALAAPQERSKYGQQFDAVVQAVLGAWEACHKEEENEFQEYRYKEQLKDQVREALHHIQNLQQPP